MLPVLAKVQDFLLGYEEDEESVVDDEKDSGFIEPVSVKRRDPMRRNENYAYAPKHDNVTRLYPEAKYEIILTKPKSVDDAPGIVNSIRANNVCVISLEGIDKDKAQRIADFLSGSTYAFGGIIERISNEIFIIAPNGVNISGKLKSEIKSESSILPWASGR